MTAPTPQPWSVFIDANVYLSFFAYSDDDLEVLLKIKALIADGLIEVFVPDQVRNEVMRRRETAIQSCINDFTKDMLPTKLPILMKDLAEAEPYLNACKEAAKNRQALVKKFKEMAAEEKLKADTVIQEIWDSSTKISQTDKLYLNALQRKRQGNPPGKGTVIGDELNWESLLAVCPDGRNLHIVSKDGDYSSGLQSGSPKQFLDWEWKSRKQSDVFLYQQIGLFLNTFDSHLKLATDEKKLQKVDDLVNSPSFSSTHAAVANLTPYVPLLTHEDVTRLANAAISNTQINWIREDDDVRSLYREILKEHLDNLELTLKEAMQIMFMADNTAELNEEWYLVE